MEKKYWCVFFKISLILWDPGSSETLGIYLLLFKKNSGKIDTIRVLSELDFDIVQRFGSSTSLLPKVKKDTILWNITNKQQATTKRPANVHKSLRNGFFGVKKSSDFTDFSKIHCHSHFLNYKFLLNSGDPKIQKFTISRGQNKLGSTSSYT